MVSSVLSSAKTISLAKASVNRSNTVNVIVDRCRSLKMTQKDMATASSISRSRAIYVAKNGAPGQNRTDTPLRERDFESRASTSSATGAPEVNLRGFYHRSSETTILNRGRFSIFYLLGPARNRRALTMVFAPLGRCTGLKHHLCCA